MKFWETMLKGICALSFLGLQLSEQLMAIMKGAEVPIFLPIKICISPEMAVEETKMAITE
jgi:hypothetical protein